VLTTSSILLLIATLILWPILQFTVNSVSADDSTPTAPSPSETPVITSSPTASATPTFTPKVTNSPVPPSPTFAPVITNNESSSPLQAGLVVLALNEAGHNHLFANQALATRYLRLTSGPWDDISPALSPDGRWLAFASNRSGSWDIYLLDLQSGDLKRLTETLQYDASPTWSPDGKLLAYESYDQDYEIIIQSAFDDQTMINLSQHPAADYQPNWSPLGRQLAFVSNRSGEPEVWLADFDTFDEERFSNLSSNPEMAESHPIWSPDGTSLAWAARQEQNSSLFIWNPDQGSRYVGSGDWPVWSPDGSLLLSSLSNANQSMLTAYQSADAMLALPPIILPGGFAGLTWGKQPLPSPLPLGLLQISLEEPQLPWTSGSSEDSNSEEGLHNLANLNGIQAPYPQLHDSVDEAFQALRERVSAEAGWDFLATLENAFVPLSAPLAPGMGEDWLYTGRAFAFDTLPMNAGWLAVVPEIYGHQTYWRVYIKARFQNGSQGKPMLALPWVFNARYAGDPLLYEQGGEMGSGIPTGYWVDFTEIAQALGWQRLPALPTWQSAFFAARFNEFVIPADKTWQGAMHDLYPVEFLLTPTPILPPTLTPTRTPSWPIVSTPAP
jgi:TolB protein